MITVSAEYQQWIIILISKHLQLSAASDWKHNSTDFILGSVIVK